MKKKCINVICKVHILVIFHVSDLSPRYVILHIANTVYFEENQHTWYNMEMYLCYFRSWHHRNRWYTGMCSSWFRPDRYLHIGTAMRNTHLQQFIYSVLFWLCYTVHVSVHVWVLSSFLHSFVHSFIESDRQTTSR